ncbi:MAG TPA: hypothetical protein VEX43_08790 [Chthoniobacterales bacterium]|nr:hypothetical protein [Chthoniobacterales bacterium]
MKKCSSSHAIVVKLFPSAAIWALLTGCASVTEVERVSENTDLGRGGITYSLPITHVRVAVPLEEASIVVTRTATLSKVLIGVEPLAEFKTDLPKTKFDEAIAKAPQKTALAYGVGEGTQINIVGEPDSRQTFYARLKGGPFRDTTATFKLNNKGVMTKGTSEVENKTIDFAVSTIETATKFAAGLIKPASALRPATPTQLEAAAKAYGLGIPALEAGLRIERLEGPVRDEEIKKIEKENPDAWQEWRARGKPVLKEIELADELIDLRNRREGLSTGLEVIPNVETLKLKLAELDGQIAKKTSHFVGEQKKTPWTANFNCVPLTVKGGVRRNYVESHTLLVIDEETPSVWFSNGLLDRSPFLVAGKKPAKKGSSKNEVILVLNSSALPTASLTPRLSAEPARHGFPYRVPAATVAVVNFNDKQLSRLETRVAQHGIVAYLPRSLGSKKLKVDLDLDESSGSLTGLTTSSTAFDPALIGRVGAGAGEILDAQKARAKAEEDKNDPVNKLTRRKELLQLQKDIQTLEAEGYVE